MQDKRKKEIRLRTYGNDYHAAYVELADHPHQLVHCVHKTVRIHSLIPDYDGPGLAIDFDNHGRAIGIEILYPHLEGEDREAELPDVGSQAELGNQNG